MATFASCLIWEISRLGRTLRQWKDTYLVYFTTGGADNCGTEALIGIIELQRRIARGYRNATNVRLRMLLVTDGPLLPRGCDRPVKWETGGVPARRAVRHDDDGRVLVEVDV